MNMTTTDCRLDAPTWDGGVLSRRARTRATVLAVASTVALVLYFWWLLRPGRAHCPVPG